MESAENCAREEKEPPKPCNPRLEQQAEVSVVGNDFPVEKSSHGEGLVADSEEEVLRFIPHDGQDPNPGIEASAGGGIGILQDLKEPAHARADQVIPQLRREYPHQAQGNQDSAENRDTARQSEKSRDDHGHKQGRQDACPRAARKGDQDRQAENGDKDHKQRTWQSQIALSAAQKSCCGGDEKESAEICKVRRFVERTLSAANNGSLQPDELVGGWMWQRDRPKEVHDAIDGGEYRASKKKTVDPPLSPLRLLMGKASDEEIDRRGVSQQQPTRETADSCRRS